MAQTAYQHPTQHGAIILLTFVALLSPQNAAARNGFSLELIHRDSIYSPLYPGNLTDVERLRRLARIAESHANWRLRPKQVGIRPSVSNHYWQYMVRVGIGSPPTLLHLFLDSGSSTIWTQCPPCDPCFEQLPPMYTPSDSSTYHALPYNHPLCIPHSRTADGLCSFERRYDDNSYTRGVLATELFTLATRSGGSESIPGVVFGCSHQTNEDMFGNPKIGGMLGLGRGPHSFVMQLGDRALRRFSYCLTPITQEGISYLRFGSDISISRNAQVTPFLRTNSHVYELDLIDITVNGRRLNLPPGTFALRPDDTGGCIIDTGASITHLIRPAYDAVKGELMRYFEGHDLTRMDGSELGMDLCYRKRQNHPTHYPTMVFHFRGADLRLETLNLFYIIRETPAFCFTMAPHDRSTYFGATQQQNIRFIFDLRAQQLVFKPVNCVGN